LRKTQSSSSCQWERLKDRGVKFLSNLNAWVFLRKHTKLRKRNSAIEIESWGHKISTVRLKAKTFERHKDSLAKRIRMLKIIGRTRVTWD